MGEAAFLASPLRRPFSIFAFRCCSYRIMITLNLKPLTKTSAGSDPIPGSEIRGFSLQNTVFWLYSGDSNRESRMLSSEARFPCCNTPARVLRKAAASCSKRCLFVCMLPRRLQMHRTLNPQPLQLAALRPKPSTTRGSPTTPASPMLSKPRHARPPLIGGYGG